MALPTMASAQSSDAPPAQGETGSAELGTLRIEDGLGQNNRETGAERDARRDNQVYDLDISSTFKGREEIERYRGTSTADALSGMVNVFSGDARNGGALDPSIRGIQGPGRVPVIVDGTEQALTVWRGYNGASNRNYIDPSLMSGVQVLKGPATMRGVAGSTGGAVVINTLDAADILETGQNFGIEVKLEGGNNSTKPRLPTLLTGQDYRDVPNFLCPGAFPSPTFAYCDGSLRVNLRTPSDNNFFSMGDRAIRVAAAGRKGDFEIFGAYAFRERGNFFSGTGHPEYYQQEEGAQNSRTFVRKLGLHFYPGHEVTNTSSRLESWMFKLGWQIDENQSLKFGFRDSKSRFGDILPSRIMQNNGGFFGNVQWPLSNVDMQAYNLDYKWNPENPLIDFNATLWATDTVSDTYSSGGFPNSATAADPIIRNTAFTNARNHRYGVNASNLFQISDNFSLLLDGNFQYEKLRSDDVYDQASMIGWRQFPREGRRNEYRLALSAAWQATPFLKLEAGLSYGGYWAKDDFIDKLIDAEGGSYFLFPTEYYRQTYYTIENGQQVPHEAPDWRPDKNGIYRANDSFCLNGGGREIENFGFCLSTPVSKGVTLTSGDDLPARKASRLTPHVAATVNLSPNSRLYGRYTQKFRFPSLFESTTGFTASINPLYPLLPEKIHAFEASFVQDLRPLLKLSGEGQAADVKLTFYRNVTHNVIERTTSLRFNNIERQVIEGFELQARYDDGKFFADLGAGWMTTNISCDARSASVDIWLRVPHCVNYGFMSGFLLTQATPDKTVNLSAGARLLDRRLEVGGRIAWHAGYDNPQLDRFTSDNPSECWLPCVINTPFTWDEIFTLDAFAKFRINKQVTAELSGLNLFNRYYLDPLSRSMLPAPGRTVRLSLTGRF